jgi:hypothetical protein
MNPTIVSSQIRPFLPKLLYLRAMVGYRHVKASTVFSRKAFAPFPPHCTQFGIVCVFPGISNVLHCLAELVDHFSVYFTDSRLFSVRISISILDRQPTSSGTD